MKVETVSIKKLKSMELNPRKITKREVEKLKNSLNEFGAVQPIVVNKDGTIIGGNQRFRAMKEFGYKEVPVVKLDLPKDKARALNIALNKIGGEWDDDLLHRFVKGLNQEELVLSGFSQNELKRFQYDFDELSKQMNELDDEYMKVIEWKARFKQAEWEGVKKIIMKLKRKYGFPAFNSEPANAKVILLLCKDLKCDECKVEEECNAQILKGGMKEWEENEKHEKEKQRKSKAKKKATKKKGPSH